MCNKQSSKLCRQWLSVACCSSPPEMPSLCLSNLFHFPVSLVSFPYFPRFNQANIHTLLHCLFTCFETSDPLSNTNLLSLIQKFHLLWMFRMGLPSSHPKMSDLRLLLDKTITVARLFSSWGFLILYFNFNKWFSGSTEEILNLFETMDEHTHCNFLYFQNKISPMCTKSKNRRGARVHHNKFGLSLNEIRNGIPLGLTLSWLIQVKYQKFQIWLVYMYQIWWRKYMFVCLVFFFFFFLIYKKQNAYEKGNEIELKFKNKKQSNS